MAMRSDIVHTASSGTLLLNMYNVFYHAKNRFIFMIVCQ